MAAASTLDVEETVVVDRDEEVEALRCMEGEADDRRGKDGYFVGGVGGVEAGEVGTGVGRIVVAMLLMGVAVAPSKTGLKKARRERMGSEAVDNSHFLCYNYCTEVEAR